MRRFMQTFVLAPQSPKKYYVHNDIFRYQDEVFEEAAGDTSTGTTEDQIREMKETAAVTVQEAAAKATAPVPPVEMIKEQAPVARHTNGANTQYGEPLPSAGEPMHVEEPGGHGAEDWKESAVISSPPAAAFQAAPAEQWKPSEAVETIEDAGEEAVEVTEAGPGDQEAAPAPSEPQGPRTWSSMVKSGPSVAPGKPPVAPQASVGGQREGPKEGTPFSGVGQPAGAQVKPAASQSGGYQRTQRGSSQGRSPGQQPQPGQRPERFSKEEDSTKNG